MSTQISSSTKQRNWEVQKFPMPGLRTNLSSCSLTSLLILNTFTYTDVFEYNRFGLLHFKFGEKKLFYIIVTVFRILFIMSFLFLLHLALFTKLSIAFLTYGMWISTAFLTSLVSLVRRSQLFIIVSSLFH